MPFSPDDIIANITPTEFELLVKEYLTELGKELKSFETIHNKFIDRIDGDYQIDVYAEFRFLGADFKLLIECKKHKNKIKRETVQLLYDKIRATGAHKGMIFSTSGFQDGALKFAHEHSVALIRVIEGKYTYFTKAQNSANFEPPPWADIPKYVGEFIDKNTITYLQIGYMDSLDKFLFKNGE